MTKRELFLANAYGQYTERTPIWIMRQAGRYLPEYRRVREEYSFEEICKTPKLAAEVTMQPVDIFGFDAAIIFSDILFVLEPLGFDLRYEPGPILSPLLEKPEQIKKLKSYEPETHLSFVAEALVETRKRLADDTALLGFCGAPFTLFCYLCGSTNGDGSGKALNFLNNYPHESRFLLDTLSDISAGYLTMQIKAGADAVQIFDTSAGELSSEEFRQWSFPYLDKIIDRIKRLNGIVSLFIKGTHHLLDDINRLKADIISVDWMTPISEARSKLRPKTIQGNLNPNTLFGTGDNVIAEATGILDSMSDYPGFIFNLGHGILPETPVENVRALVETVHSYRRKNK